MIVILYHSKHGSTAKIGRVIKAYIEGECTLMDLDCIDYNQLSQASTIVLGMPVYYGVLDSDMVKFIRFNQPLLKSKNYSLYITCLQSREFMTFVTNEFDYDLLKDIKVIAGLGGALYYPKLSIGEKMVLNVMNRRVPVIPKEHDNTIFENFNNNEIEIFAKKISRIEEAR